METETVKKKRAKAWYGLWAILIIAALVASVAAFWEYLPYNLTAERQIGKTLKSYGLEVVSLEVETLNKSQAVMNNIQLGKDPGFKIGHVQATYSLPKLRDIKVHEIEVEQVQTHVYMKDGKLVVSGLEPLMAEKPDSDKPPLIFDTAALKEILPQNLHAKDVTLTGKDPKWSFETKLDADLKSVEAPILHLTTPALSAVSGEYQITATNIDVNAVLNEEKKQWDAKLAAKNFVVGGIDAPIPPVNLTADMALTEEKITAVIHAVDDKKTHFVQANISLPMKDPRAGSLAVKQLKFPWGGGMISLKPVTIPLTFTKPISLAIQLEKVDLSELLSKLGEGKVNGTGQISGVLPITYYPDGRVTLQEGKASALSGGLIQVSPTLLPGENEQLQVARTTLENFHYTTLKISVSSDKDQRSTIHLTIEGNNPNAFDGRPVKLNVNLAGDILPLLQQSVLPINNLQQLLKLQDTK